MSCFEQILPDAVDQLELGNPFTGEVKSSHWGITMADTSWRLLSSCVSHYSMQCTPPRPSVIAPYGPSMLESVGN